MKVRDVACGTRFRFAGRPNVYVSRGNGWYDSPGGYAGGPWCEDHDKQKDVDPIPADINKESRT